MSPTTFTADGRVIQHESETPPAEALTPPAAPAPEGAPPAPKPPKPPRSQTRTRAGKIANAQARQRRVGKHRK